MRYPLLCVFATMLACSPTLYAQTRDKIAIVHYPYYFTALDTIVRAEAVPSVEIDSALPTNLNEFDAIFFQPFPYTLDSSTQVRLVNYIENGGKLYIQAIGAVTDSTDSANPLWVRFGIEGNMYTALSFDVTGVYGVTNEFTENISDSLPPHVYRSGYGGPYGSIVPVLVVAGFENGQPLAYRSTDNTIKMVLDEGGSGQESYPGYYPTFISDILCSYFNLCAEGVKAAPQLISTNTISIVRDSRDRGFSVSGNFTTGSEISVLNALGMILWRSKVHAGAHLIELPTDLRNGFYFVTIRQGETISVARFTVAN